MNGTISVLIVDDEPAVADLAATHLERLHEEIDTTVETSVGDALERFERATVDCVVSDYTMPGMDGLELLSAVRDTTPDVPFVLFTGKGSEEIASEAISAGVTDYLQKGTGTEQYELLGNRIVNAVERHRAAKRADELARINGVINGVQRELVRQSTREDIERSVCVRLAESAPYTLAWVGEPDADDEFVAHARAGTGTEYLDEMTIRTDDTRRGQGPVGTAFRTNEVRALRNIAENTDFEPWREAVARYGHESVIALPLRYDDEDYGVLTVYSNRRYAFGGDERAALEELAGTVGQAIHAVETRARLERREHALAASERKYRSLIDAAPDAVLVADADTGGVVETNDAAETLLDRSRAEILGTCLFEFHPEGQSERYRALFERHAAAGRGNVARFEDGSDVLVVRPDGERVPVEITISTVAIDGRTLAHAAMRDVSARRQRARALHEERGVTAGVFEALPDPVYAFDTDGSMLRWNDEFESVVGYSGDEIAEMDCLEFVPSEDRELFADRIDAIVEDDETVTVESALVTKAGETIPHEFSGARLTRGGTVRGVIGTGRDIAERRERETAVAALHGATRDLVSAEDRADVARAAAAAVEDILDFPISVVRLRDDETDALEPLAVTAATERLLGDPPVYDRGEALPWRALRTGEPVVTDEDPPIAADGYPACQQLYVPIGDRGTISIATPTDTIDDTDIRLARVLAANTATALDRVERETTLQRYKRMLDTARDSVYTLDDEGRFTAVNEELLRRTGYTREEVLGAHVSLLLDDEDVERGEALVMDLLSRDDESESESYEMSVHTAEGDAIPSETHVSLLYTSDGFEGTVGVVRDIAARKKREHALEAARSRFRALTENTTLGVVTVDEGNTITYANDAVENVFGYEPAELVGEPLTTVMPERLREDHREGFGRYLDDGTRTLDWEWIEFPGEHRDGHEMDLGVSFGEHVTEDEHRFTATVRDITEQKRHERAIAGLHGATRDLVGAEGREGVARATVAAAEEVLDFPVTSVRLYDPETDALEPVAVTDTTERVLGERPTYQRGEGVPWEAFEAGESVVVDTAVRGDGIPVRHRLYVPIGDHGTITVAVGTEAGTFDEMEIRLTEVLAANAAAALDRVERERELHRFRRMLDTAGDGIYALDAKGRYTAVNDRFIATTGYSREEILGAHTSSLTLDAEDVERGEELIRDLLSEGAGASASYEVTTHTADGDAVPCEARITPLYADGEFEGTVGVVRDITERKEDETYRRELYETMSSTEVTFDERVDRLLDLGCEYLGTDIGFMTRIEDGTQRIDAAKGSHALIQPGEECPLSRSYCRRTVETDGPLAVHDATSMGWKGAVAYETFGLETYIGGKITVNNEVYGTFCFADTDAREPFTNAEQGFVDLVARGVGRELERRERERALEALHDAAREMTATADRDEVAAIAVKTVERALDIPGSGVWLADESGTALEPVAQSTYGRDVIETPPTFSEGDASLAWRAFERGEARCYDHVDHEPDSYNPETTIRSEIIVPLDEYGVLIIGSTEPEQFDEGDVSLAKLLGANTEAALSRAEREHQLVVERDRLTALFENVPDAAVSYELVDGDPVARNVNPQFETVFGYAGETVRGESIDEYIVPAEREAEAAEFNEALTRGESLQTTVRRRTAGGVRDFLLHVVPITLGEHNAEGYSIYTDITDQKHRERELERQNQLLDDFASVISHDLRNPMSVARGRLELAHEECPSEHHADVEWAIDRMDTLIEDVLTLTRQGKIIGDTERVALETVAETAWRTAGTETAALSVEDPGVVEADADRLTRLFENLFRNATEHAGADATVTVGGLDGGFYVADDGPGIPEDERETVFEHGYTTADSGTGLGLMIVRNIANAHGWTVRVVESEADGARFEVRT